MRTLHQCPPSPNHGPCPGHSSQWTFQHFLEGTAYHLQTSLAAFSVTLDQMYFQNFQYQECEPLHSEDEEEAQVRCGKTLSTKLKPPGERKRVSALVFSRPHQNPGEHRPSMDLNLQCLFKLHRAASFLQCYELPRRNLKQYRHQVWTAKWDLPNSAFLPHHSLQSNVIRATVMKINLSFLTLLRSFQTRCIKFAKFTGFVKDNQSNLCFFLF